ncbi:hypothetical protein CsSME_00016149 [Camellia sinensis var. sinensis]
MECILFIECLFFMRVLLWMRGMMGGGRGGYGGGGDRRRDNYRDSGGSGPDRNYHGGNRSRPY